MATKAKAKPKATKAKVDPMSQCRKLHPQAADLLDVVDRRRHTITMLRNHPKPPREVGARIADLEHAQARDRAAAKARLPISLQHLAE